MDILLNTLFWKKKSDTDNRARLGRLYSEGQLLRAQESAMDTEEGAPGRSRPQPVEFVLDTKHPLPLREFVKIMEKKAAMLPLPAQPRKVTLFLDTKPSVAAAQVVRFVEGQEASLSALTPPSSLELVLDVSHPLAIREVIKFAETEAADPSSPTPQRRVQLVLDLRQKPRSR